MDLNLSTWREIHSRYKYAEKEGIRRRIKKKGYTATPEDIDIINQIALWKLNRQVHLDNETIEFLNTVAKTVNNPDTEGAL